MARLPEQGRDGPLRGGGPAPGPAVPHQPGRGVVAGLNQVPQDLPPGRRDGVENRHPDLGKAARGTGHGKAFEDLAADVRSRRIGDSGNAGRVGQR